MHTMNSVKIESASFNDLELNIIKIDSLFSQKAITSSVSSIIGRRNFTQISPCVSLKTYSYTFYIIIII